jgi:TonB family protein
MKHAVLVSTLLVSSAALAMGCASKPATMADDHPGKHRSGKAKQGTFESSAGAGQMGLQNEVGVYEVSDIEDTMSAHMDDVRACYRRAGHAQRYAEGKVTLRFSVSGNGTPSDVLVVATDLGNYDVERCLVEVGRRIKFPPPDGKKATTFEYPVEFRSTHGMQVQDLDDSLKLDHDIATFIHLLAPCGAVTETGASARFYIEPNGNIGSVGLAADSALDEQAGACVVKEMRHWRMSATLPGRMLRCRVNIPAIIAAAEPPAKSPLSRRRRR